MSTTAGARRRVAILISGRGSNMLSLLEAAARPGYPAEIVLVASNRPDAGGLARAASFGVPTLCVDHRAHAGREPFELALHKTLVEHGVDLVCLAGFMRVLTPWFVSRWDGRLLNIHPSLLPAFRGLHTHERALAEGVRLHGATVHFVIPELDAGAIIAQGAVPVLAGDTPGTLAARVLGVEHVLYPHALDLVASDRAHLRDGRVVMSDPSPAAPINALIWPGPAA